jgi:hypothetical protein
MTKPTTEDYLFYNLVKPGDKEALVGRLEEDFCDHVYEKTRLNKIIRLIRADRITVVAENFYVDKRYRDTYYLYYSQKFMNIPRDCVRLVFFDGRVAPDKFFESPPAGRERQTAVEDELNKALIGFLVLQPIPQGNIGHTILNPEKLNVRGYIRQGTFKLTLLGRKLSVAGFPFSQQDAQVLSCAETTIYHLMEYYGGRYPEYRTIMPSEIIAIAREDSPERVLPSSGLQYEIVTDIFTRMGFSPVMYSSGIRWKEFGPPLSIKDILHYYIESGIPLAIALKKQGEPHSIIGIGHGEPDYGKLKNSVRIKIYSAGADDNEPMPAGKYFYLADSSSAVSEYIVMDDNLEPYAAWDAVNARKEGETGTSPAETIDHIMVPLHKRVFVRAEDARVIFIHLLQNFTLADKIMEAYSDLNFGTEKNPMIFRMFLTTSRSYKSFKTTHTADDAMRKQYMRMRLPQFIWIVELSDLAHCREHLALAEIVLDATASFYDLTRGVLSIRYKAHFACQGKNLTELLKTLYDDTNQSTFGDPFLAFEESNLKRVGSDLAI